MLGKVERKLALNTSELVDIHICVIYKYVLLIYKACVILYISYKVYKMFLQKTVKSLVLKKK